MARQPVIGTKMTSQLRLKDIVVKLDDRNRVADSLILVKEIETLGCRGRHFDAKDANGSMHHVCYLPGKVMVVI